MRTIYVDFSAGTSPNKVRSEEYNHNECVACGRVTLGPSKLRAAAQGIHYDYLSAVAELCENDLGDEVSMMYIGGPLSYIR